MAIKTEIIATIVVLGLPVAARAQAISRIADNLGERYSRPEAIFEANPAAMTFMRNYSLSDISLGADIIHSDEAQTVQEGTGLTDFSAMALSYMHLNASTTVWGYAGYATGKRSDVAWNNSADYRLVAPYVIGDSVGGDLTHRQYEFGGGYAGVHGPWGWGAEATFRAAFDYRNRDPRDKIIVSDLNIKLGGTRRLGATYTVGLGASIRVYNQESDVEFFNPVNEIRAYPLTGLGSTYARFSGNSKFDTAYKGFGYGASLQLFPAQGSGWMASLEWRQMDIRQVLRAYNNLELTTNAQTALSARIVRPLSLGRLTLSPTLSGRYAHRNGDENIFGTAVGNNYPQIGSRRNYKLTEMEARLSVLLSLRLGDAQAASPIRNELEMIPSASYYLSDQQLIQPSRQLKAAALTPGLGAGVRLVRPKWLLRIAATGSYRSASEQTRRLDGLDPERSLTQATIHNFDMLTANATTLGGNADLYIALKDGITLRIAASGRSTAYAGHGHGWGMSVRAGVVF